MNLRESLEYSIERVGKDISYCKEELENGVNGLNIHRNTLGYISGSSGSFFYFNEDNSDFLDIRAKANAVISEREVYLDLLLRRHFNVSDMIRVFEAQSTDMMVSLAHKLRREGALIGTCDILMYFQCLGSSFESLDVVKGLYFYSDFRKGSVREELFIFERYIFLCQGQLSLLK